MTVQTLCVQMGKLRPGTALPHVLQVWDPQSEALSFGLGFPRPCQPSPTWQPPPTRVPWRLSPPLVLLQPTRPSGYKRRATLPSRGCPWRCGSGLSSRRKTAERTARGEGQGGGTRQREFPTSPNSQRLEETAVSSAQPTLPALWRRPPPESLVEIFFARGIVFVFQCK